MTIVQDEELHRRVLTWREAHLEKDDPKTLLSMGNLATVLADEGRLEEAESLSRDVLTRTEAKLGMEHADTLITVSNLAFTLQELGQLAEAEALFCRAGFTERLGADHPSTQISARGLAAVRAELAAGISASYFFAGGRLKKYLGDAGADPRAAQLRLSEAVRAAAKDESEALGP